MHACPDCGQACYCDGEDHENDYALLDDCAHICDEIEEDFEDYVGEHEYVRDCGTPGCIQAALFQLHYREDCETAAMAEAYDRYLRFEGVNRRQVLV